MEHYAPHPSSKFEGFYSKFDLPSDAHLALIICSVPGAQKHPAHMISFTYYSPTGSRIFQREHFVPAIHRVSTNATTHAFELWVPELGSMRCEADSTTTWELETEDWKFKARTTGRTPWDKEWETPEGWIVKLPLPLHWHVQSLASPCEVELDIPSLSLPEEDRVGNAIVHLEKNWANSFPSAHMWIQAQSPSSSSSICLAGGKILGMTAYLLGYRSANVNVSFRPPFSLSLFGLLSPFMSVNVDWENRAFAISVQGLWKKIELKASAPKEKGWFGLAAPFFDGHRSNFLTESFLARIEVKVSQRGWWPWGKWTPVKEEVFENGSLEFGGDYFPERGEKRE